MTRSSIKITTCALAAVITFSNFGLTAKAGGVTSVLPSGGVNISLAKGTSLEDLQQVYGGTTAKIESMLDRIALEEAWAKAGITPEKEETEDDILMNLVIAQVNNYVNVRSIPSEEGEIVGKLYNKSVGTFISEQDGWYEISSGNVTGFVKAEYCVTGDAAIELAKVVSTRIATVNTTTLKVRTEPGLDASVLGLVPFGDDLVVLDETDEWVQVDVEEGIGWVSVEYVELKREYVVAESREEEEKRLAKEEAERKKAHEAAKAAKAAQAAQTAQAASSSQSESSAGSSASQSAAVSVGSGSEMGVSVAEYAVQFVGNPYVYGGSSLTSGADCSGFVMSVYSNFGVSLPHSSSGDRSQGSAVDSLDSAAPGDIICYSGHVGIYIGNGQIVHASTKKTGIIVSNASYKKILAIRRIF